MPLPKKHTPLTETEAWNKVTAFCAYRERSRKEVIEKLYAYGLDKDTIEKLLKRLESEKYLQEERFAYAFAGGKFRLKNWGKRRIELELKARGIPEKDISNALNEIQEKDYLSTLKKLADKKEKELLSKEPNEWKRRQKIAAFLIRKGYEQEKVFKMVGIYDV
jgi:regulatory protein